MDGRIKEAFRYAVEEGSFKDLCIGMFFLTMSFAGMVATFSMFLGLYKLVF